MGHLFDQKREDMTIEKQGTRWCGWEHIQVTVCARVPEVPGHRACNQNLGGDVDVDVDVS